MKMGGISRVRCAAALAAAFVIAWTGMGVPSYAAEPAGEQEAETPEQKAEREAFEMPVQTNKLKGWPEGPGTYGEAGIVMEVGTGAVLYAKNIDEQEYPASITKALTALVAFENGDLQDRVTFSQDSVAFLQPGDSSIGLKEGNDISLEEGLSATLLASANEAAYAVGESVGHNAGKDYNWFLEQMNTRCRELGGQNSNFVNTNGLHDPNHYTSARDMALIGRELFKHPDFFRIVQTLNYTIPATGTCEEHIFQQKHKMLIPENSNYYEYAVGGKTGFTSDALSTLITMGEKDGVQLVCVILRTHGVNIYSDTRNLLDYGFQNFKKVSVADLEDSKDIRRIVEEEGAGYVMLPDGVAFQDLKMDLKVDKGMSSEATLTYTYKGNTVGSARAIVSDSYIKEHSARIKQSDDKEKEKSKKESGIHKKTVFVITVAAGAALSFAFYMNKQIKRQRRRLNRYRRRRK